MKISLSKIVSSTPRSIEKRPILLDLFSMRILFRDLFKAVRAKRTKIGKDPRSIYLWIWKWRIKAPNEIIVSRKVSKIQVFKVLKLARE